MTLTLNRCNHFSLADLAALRTEGYSVARSAHAGNLYPANLAMADQDIADIVLYDRVMAPKDRASHPNQVFLHGDREEIAPRDHLAVRGRIRESSRLAPEFGQQGRTMAECHQMALRAAFPQADIMSQTEYLCAHEEVVWAILEEVGKIAPQHFYRRMSECGCVERKLAKGVKAPWSAIKSDVFGFTNSTAGWLQGNVLNVLVYAVVESQRTGANVVYHTSGVDMNGYMGSMMPELTELYQYLYDRGVATHADLDFQLADITPMRFCGPVDEADAVAELFGVVRDYRRFEAGAGARIQGTVNGARRDMIAQVRSERDDWRFAMADAVAGCPDFMYRPHDGGFFSQYDALTLGFHVHEEALHVPLEELAKMVEAVERSLPQH